MSDKSVLVTGGAGFIGSHIVDRFVAEGWAVTVVDDLSSGKRANLRDEADFQEMSVNSSKFAALVKRGRFDVVAHLAAQIDVRRSVADPVSDAQTNILGTLNLMEALRAARRPARTIFTSTGGMLYGELNKPPNFEISPKDPESPYAISKLASEYYLAYYGRVHGLDSVALRFGNVYGPRQDPHGEAGVVAIFSGRILEGEPLTVFGDGTQTRDYIYVRDVANAAYLAATKRLPEAGRLDDRAFNIGTGIGTSVLDIVETLRRVSHAEVTMQFAPPRAGEQQESFVDWEKARILLGWRPETSLEAGLEETFKWFAARHAGAAASAAS